MPGGSSPLPHVGHEKTEADTHVDSRGEVPSDAGSTPAASTITKYLTVSDLADMSRLSIGYISGTAHRFHSTKLLLNKHLRLQT